jgi:hypothetical protein
MARDLEQLLTQTRPESTVTPTEIERLRDRADGRRRKARMTIAAAVVLAVMATSGAIAATRDSNRQIAIGNDDVSGAPRANIDHWHTAYGVWICGRFLPPLQDTRDPVGVHSHRDGIIHVHPFTKAASGPRATLEAFLRSIDASAADGLLDLPGVGSWRDGESCGGEPGQLRIVEWSPEGTRLAEANDAASVPLKDGQGITIAFGPADEAVPPPPSLRTLPQLDPTVEVVRP